MNYYNLNCLKQTDHLVKLAQKGEEQTFSQTGQKLVDAVKKGNLQEFKQILTDDRKHEFNNNEKDSSGRTLLHIAAEEGISLCFFV